MGPQRGKERSSQAAQAMGRMEGPPSRAALRAQISAAAAPKPRAPSECEVVEIEPVAIDIHDMMRNEEIEQAKEIAEGMAAIREKSQDLTMEVEEDGKRLEEVEACLDADLARVSEQVALRPSYGATSSYGSLSASDDLASAAQSKRRNRGTWVS